MTKQELLLLAADSLGGVFGAEDLAVRAWEMDRAAWGLRGHPQHVNYHNVCACLAKCSTHSRNLKNCQRLALFCKIGPNQYQLTNEADARVKELKAKLAQGKREAS